MQCFIQHPDLGPNLARIAESRLDGTVGLSEQILARNALFVSFFTRNINPPTLWRRLNVVFDNPPKVLQDQLHCFARRLNVTFVLRAEQRCCVWKHRNRNCQLPDLRLFQHDVLQDVDEDGLITKLEQNVYCCFVVSVHPLRLDNLQLPQPFRHDLKHG